MSDLGPRTFGHKEEMVFLGKEIHEEKNYSEETAREIDNQVTKFIADAYEVAKKILIDKKDLLDKISHILLEKETIEQSEFNEIMGIAPIVEVKEEVAVEATKSKTEVTEEKINWELSSWTVIFTIHSNDSIKLKQTFGSASLRMTTTF